MQRSRTMFQRSTPAARRLACRLLPILSLVLALVLAGCASTPPACVPGPLADDAIAIVSHGWHTDLAIPAAALRGEMRQFRHVFPGMAVLMVGFGKRTFMMAPVTGLGDLLVGPFPGDGTLLIAGLTAPPDRAYHDGTMEIARLSSEGADRLSDFIWRTLDVRHDQPVRIANGFFPGSIFYATRIGYSGTYTCNSWSGDALHAAGVMPKASGIVFASQVMDRVSRVVSSACLIGRRR
ncbi:MAG: DUF2459 domain-containing protein [Janthinobacterium lividum]